MIQGARIALREVYFIFVGLVAFTLGSALLRRWRIAIVLAALLAWICYFFRDPERTPDLADDDVILAPADGRVTKIQRVAEPHFIRGQAQRITIFLSIFDVHVQRSPYAGRVKLIHYQPGGFAPAFMGHADENESNLLGLETARGPFAVTQMTGILARRIVCWAKLGDELARGERFGLIKFGSRVDLYLPENAIPLVQPGQTVYGGQTVIARWQTTDQR